MDKNMNKNKEVVVIGPARSGTSMVAGILYYMGVDMGQGPNPSPSNPKGDFEDDDFRTLNREIFKSAKSGSGCWFPPTSEELNRVAHSFENKIKGLIESRSKKQIWGWKNPWNVAAAPLFIPHLNSPHLIFVFRNSDAIAKSGVRHTKRYEKLSYEEALRSAEASNSNLSRMTDEYKDRYPTHSIQFENVIKNPEIEVYRLADFLGIKLSETKKRRIMEFVIPRDEIKKERKLGALRRFYRLFLLVLTNPPAAYKKIVRRIKDKAEMKKAIHP